MEDRDRRAWIGRKIRNARKRSGYKSQAAFARAIGISEDSVGSAERGEEQVGDTIFTAVEKGLRLPPGSISSYLATGDESVLDDEGHRAVARREGAPQMHVDDLPPEMIREWVRVGMRMLPQVHEQYGEAIGRRTEDRLIELAGKAAQAEAESTTDDSDQH